MRLVYKLQNKLVTSFEGRTLAIRKVVTNSGAKTSGIDKILWSTPEQRFKAIEELGLITKNPNKYKSSPLKRVMIPKNNSLELRPLGIPTMTDRAAQAVYHLALDPVVETKSDNFSFGFRKNRSQHDAISYIRTLLDKTHSPEFILETDIAKCFDKISHDYIMKSCPICHKHVLKEWLKSGYIFENKLYKTEEGTPLLFEVGGIISPLLCNLALNGLEKIIRQEFPARKKILGISPKINIIRYDDDLIVTGSSEKILIEIKKIIENFLKIRGLELKKAKTRIVKIHKGFDFLGFNIFRKQYNPRLNKLTRQKTVLIIKPSDKAVELIKVQISKIILDKKLEIAAIIKEINPLLRGWGNYFSISYQSQNTFIKIGHLVLNSMMKWVRRKHPSKSILKAVSKYIIKGKSSSNHKWVWGINKIDPTVENKLTILNLSEIKPKKHTLLKLDLNPYLLENQTYFALRLITKNSAKLRELIYKKYNHQCPICSDSLHNGEKVELHHIKPIKDGGTYAVSNIQPLHQICHISVTHRNKN